MTETPGWTSPGSPEPAPGTSESGHPAPVAAPPAPQDAPPPPPQAGWSTPQPGWGAPQPQPGWGAPQGPYPGPQAGWGVPLSPKPGIIPLRPLGVGEIIDACFGTVRRYWRTAFGLSLGLAAVVQLVQALVDWWIHVDGTQTEAMFSRYFTMPLQLLAGIVASGLLTVVVGRGVLGQDATLKDAWEGARPRMWRLAGLTLLNVLILVGGLGVVVVPLSVLAVVLHAPALILLALLALPPAIWVWVRLSLSAPALMLEHQGVVAAMKRSWRLVRGSWWRIFGITVLFQICVGMLSAVLVIPGTVASLMVGGGPGGIPAESDSGAIAGIVISAVCYTLASTLTIPLSATLTVLLYIDQRIRREALDLELARAAGLPGYGWNAQGAAPVPGQSTPPGV
ncbi:glycerophosphoryl diester phosphodiesterase membrane domain-containing protein [Kitasatospora sp. NPDC049285]|uniref:glycerophosphoryl diester phosphodiesterase membrane domain-containing protein n=1 Tax=Kitasatospora sp. NPDC049285 TaxID=3157096 RepID=UPI00342C065D